MPIVAQAPAAGVVANTAITTAQIFPLLVNGVASSTLPAQLMIPGSSRYSGSRLKVFFSGFAAVGGTTPTLNLTLYSGTSLTPGSNTSFWAGSAQTVTTSKTYPFFAEVTLQGDTTSSASTGIQGFGIYKIGDLPATATMTDLSATSLTLAYASEPAANLCCAVTFGVANAANTATLTDFYLYVD